MKNNLTSREFENKDRSHIVYEFTCKERACSSINNSYIGLTNCTLGERMKNHRYKGAIFEHYWLQHCIVPEVEKLVDSCKILYFCDDRRFLPVFEALFIRKLKPNLNKNKTDFDCLLLDIS